MVFLGGNSSAVLLVMVVVLLARVVALGYKDLVQLKLKAPLIF